MTATLYVPVGPPASGKSRLGELLVDAGFLGPGAVISTDRLRILLTDSIRYDPATNPAVVALADRLTRARLSYDRDVYYDATNLDPVRLVTRLGCTGNVVSIRFTVDVAEIRARNALRPDPVPDHVLAEFWRRSIRLDPSVLPGRVVSPGEIATTAGLSAEMAV